MGKTVFIAGACTACLALAVCLMANSIYCQENIEGEMEKEEEEDIFDKIISVDFKATAADEAVQQLSRITGINIILHARTAQRLAKAGMSVSFSLKHVSAYNAIEVFAEYMDLDCRFRNRMVILRSKPEINRNIVIGTITIQDENLRLSLKIFQGEIPSELKKDLARGIIEQKIMHGNVLRERIEREIERGQEMLELDNLIDERFIEGNAEREEHDDEKDDNAERKDVEEDEKNRNTDKRKKEIF